MARIKSISVINNEIKINTSGDSHTHTHEHTHTHDEKGEGVCEKKTKNCCVKLTECDVQELKRELTDFPAGIV